MYSMHSFNHYKSPWSTPGATMSDKSAIKEFPCLTREIIYEALQEGKIEGRRQSMMGNPYYKLIRSEVQQLVKEKFGAEHFQKEQWKKELNSVKSELRSIPSEIRKLEEKRERLQNKEKDLCEKLGVDAPKSAKSKTLNSSATTTEKGRGGKRGRGGRGRGNSSVAAYFGPAGKAKTVQKISSDDEDEAREECDENKENESGSDNENWVPPSRGRGRGRGRGCGRGRSKKAKLDENDE